MDFSHFWLLHWQTRDTFIVENIGKVNLAWYVTFSQWRFTILLSWFASCCLTLPSWLTGWYFRLMELTRYLRLLEIFNLCLLLCKPKDGLVTHFIRLHLFWLSGPAKTSPLSWVELNNISSSQLFPWRVCMAGGGDSERPARCCLSELARASASF